MKCQICLPSQTTNRSGLRIELKPRAASAHGELDFGLFLIRNQIDTNVSVSGSQSVTSLFKLPKKRPGPPPPVRILPPPLLWAVSAFRAGTPFPAIKLATRVA